MDNFLSKIIKCLELSTSDSDGEALNAIRMANKFRLKAKKTWSDIFNNALPSYSYTPRYTKKPSKPVYEAYDEVEGMLEELLEKNLPEKTKDFIESLQNGFEKYGSLTEKQEAALRRVYNQFCEGGK